MSRDKARNALLTKAWQKTKKGITAMSYQHQKSHSNYRKHLAPDYSLDELRVWAFEQKIFHILFDEWVEQNYDKELKPSFDRFDDFKPYALDNIQIVTFRDNERKPKPVMGKEIDMLDNEYNVIKSFNNIAEGVRYLGADALLGNNVSAVCRGKRKKALGFRWRYKNETHN